MIRMKYGHINENKISKESTPEPSRSSSMVKHPSPRVHVPSLHDATPGGGESLGGFRACWVPERSSISPTKSQCPLYGWKPKNSGTPKWMVKITENPIKMDDLGGKPTIFGNIHMIYRWVTFAGTSFHQVAESLPRRVEALQARQLQNEGEREAEIPWQVKWSGQKGPISPRKHLYSEVFLTGNSQRWHHIWSNLPPCC